MVKTVVDQRHWSAGKPTELGGAGIPNEALTEAARGIPAGPGYQTNAMIQVLDAEGNQVAVEMAKFASSGLHAEPQAMERLSIRLAGAKVTGGKMIVAVDQYACPNCLARLRYFARRTGLSGFEVWVPGREDVTPKTTARTAGTRPAKMDPKTKTPSYRMEARLAQGESFLPVPSGAAEGWWPPPIEGLPKPYKPEKGQPRSRKPTPEPAAHPEPGVRPEPGVHTEPAVGLKGLGRLLSAVDLNLVDWGAQLYKEGFIEFGEDTSGRRLAWSPHGVGTVTTHTFDLPLDMRMLTPEEAKNTLEEGEYFVNKSGPVTSKLSPFLMHSGDYEWFELWQVKGGVPEYTGCRTDHGTSLDDLGDGWDEAKLRSVWNHMWFRCPAVEVEPMA
jgi:hypothetical protein